MGSVEQSAVQKCKTDETKDARLEFMFPLHIFSDICSIFDTVPLCLEAKLSVLSEFV